VETCLEAWEATRTLLLAGELARSVVAHDKSMSTNENKAFTEMPFHPSTRAPADKVWLLNTLATHETEVCRWADLLSTHSIRNLRIS
jgi:hypothetical protein